MTEEVFEMQLTEGEILIFREGLFKCFRDDIINQAELEEIDNKIKEVFKND